MRNGKRVRKREARFIASEAEHELIRQAAALRDLHPATYMRSVILPRARQDLARHTAEH